ncbi:hypothetical protein [Mucilaginibacter sp. L196]|uniref:hypothetical protein n=1 Tax=Mucilaginibacter sp. L196 TaxID=1641870 RepID=UPI00131B5DDD|nr:hypothetical protein [Mucilaginibacter sp. L196]
MKNCKTTLFGIGSAFVLVLVTFLVKRSVDPETMAIAIGLVGVGWSAKDAPIVIQSLADTASEIPLLKTSAGQQIVGLGDSVIDLTSASHPTNILLSDIKTGIDTLNQNISAAPAAPSVVTITDTNDAPAATEEVAPVIAEPTNLEKAQIALQAAQDLVSSLTIAPPKASIAA